jgi:hypothetical protein
MTSSPPRHGVAHAVLAAAEDRSLVVLFADEVLCHTIELLRGRRIRYAAKVAPPAVFG